MKVESELCLRGPLLFFLLLLAVSLLQGCGGAAGGPGTATAVEQEWVLIRNPRAGATMAEPEYVWVDRREIPAMLTGVLFGQEAILAPPEAYAKADPPPGPGRIWRPAEGEAGGGAIATPGARGVSPAPSSSEGRASAASPPARPEERRGYVVFVDGIRIVIDLADGEVKQGALIAITRRQTLTHPVTGEHLGELVQEVGRARIVAVEATFSVAELIGFTPGVTVRPKDRVTILP